MSDNIPFELQEEIIKRLPVKPLIQFRSVSKAWKSLIDSPQFISAHTLHRSHSHRLLVGYAESRSVEHGISYVSILDDDTFHSNMFDLTVPWSFIKLFGSKIVGSSQGLFCLSGYYERYVDSLENYEELSVAVLWNPSIRKSIAIHLPKSYASETVIGFGVCPVTSDPKILLARKFTRPGLVTWDEFSMAGQVKVFTLSSGDLKILNVYMPFELKLNGWRCSQAVVDGFIYWLASDWVSVDGRNRIYNLIMSFDLVADEFNHVYLPDTLAFKLDLSLSVSELRDSLAVIDMVDSHCCDIWRMEDGVSRKFMKFFTFKVPAPSYINCVLGFKKNGEPIVRMVAELDNWPYGTRIAFYNPISKHFCYNWIYGCADAIFAYSYTETLLLLNQKEFGMLV